MSMQFNDIIMYTDLFENKFIHDMLRFVKINGDHNVCMIWDTAPKLRMQQNMQKINVGFRSQSRRCYNVKTRRCYNVKTRRCYNVGL